VQTPQSYRNADPVMRNLRLERWLMPDEESFYRWIEPCRDAVGAVVCAGTSFVVRRTALEQVGGFETGTPSEDLATGIRITAAGWRNRFLAEKLSAGLAPFTAAAMARQRCRWASGTLQVLRTGANPLTIPGLKPLQRLAYLEGIVHWWNVIPQLVLTLMPLSLGVLGVAPLRLSGEGLLLHALPFYGAQLLLIRWLSGQSRTALLPELYRWIFLLPLVASVLLTLMGRPQRFRVTPKALAVGRRTTPAKRLLLPLLFLISLQLVSLVNLLRPALGAVLAPLSGATLAVNLLWAALNLLMLALALRACFDRPGLSELPWFALALPCRLHRGGKEQEAQLEAISEAGVELRVAESDGGLLPDPLQPLELTLPGLPLLPLQPLARHRGRLGAHWGACSNEQCQALRRFLYSREGVWPVRLAPPEPLALAVVIARLLLGCRPEGWFHRSLVPQNPPLPLM
jgi:cellulose synthase (UDP-forming)